MQKQTRTRGGAMRRHAFGFDAIMARPDYRRFQDWYATTSFLAPKRAELEAMFSRPEGRQ